MKSTKYSSSEEFFPMDKGNFWVYVDSLWNNDQLIETNYDTVYVDSSLNVNKYHIDFNGERYTSVGDSVYICLKGENKKEITSLYFFAVDDDYKFIIEKDVDIVEERLIEQKNLFKFKNTIYKKCYKYIDHCNSYFILAEGVGILEHKFISCKKRYQFIKKKTLIDYYVTRN